MPRANAHGRLDRVGARLVAVPGLIDFRFNVPARAEAALGSATGAAAGLIAGPTAILVIPSVPYMQSFDLDKTEFTQAFGLTASIGLALGLGVYGGLALSQAVLPGVAATLRAFAGMAAGGLCAIVCRLKRFAAAYWPR